MRILVVNDDGITSDGIIKLAQHASKFGNVTVVAPKTQCSAMSQKLTIFEPLDITSESFPVDGINAYSVSGTPADCVKIAVQIIMDSPPDIVFSGINKGYNLGFDIAYSGTIGACFEALQLGIPAIAFSTDFKSDFELVDRYFDEITKKLLYTPISDSELFNVNFPSCPAENCRGIKSEVPVAKAQYYSDNYDITCICDGHRCAKAAGHVIYSDEIPDGTDICAVCDGFISVSRIHNPVL